MTFQPELVPTFLEVFESSKQKIRAREGCQHLELLQDKNTPNILFTFSYWTSENDLNSYRGSELFETTWAKTKILFSDKPQAWSLEVASKID